MIFFNSWMLLDLKSHFVFNLMEKFCAKIILIAYTHTYNLDFWQFQIVITCKRDKIFFTFSLCSNSVKHTKPFKSHSKISTSIWYKIVLNTEYSMYNPKHLWLKKKMDCIDIVYWRWKVFCIQRAFTAAAAAAGADVVVIGVIVFDVPSLAFTVFDNDEKQ